MDTVAIVGGTVIDGNGGKPIGEGVILIEGRRITAVGDQSVVIPPHAKRIDAAGRFVIPGLMDANVHLVLDFGPLTLIRYENRYDELAVEAAQVALKNGVTTVFDTWGPRQSLLKARDAINAGQVAGSRIFLAGNIVGLGGPFSNDFIPRGALPETFTAGIDALWQENVGPELVWMSPEQVRSEVRSYIRRGVDFIKFAVTTHRGSQEHIMFSPRVQRVIVEEAHRAGVTAQTHTTTNEGLDMAIRADVDLMQHVDLTFGPEPLPVETVELMAERGIPGALLPQTARALDWYRAQSDRTPFLRRYEVMERNAVTLIRSGAVLLLSTDAGLFGAHTLNSQEWNSWQLTQESLLILGEGHFRWLQAVEEKGMKPMDALRAATLNIARAYKVDKDLGTIEAGKLADLLILERNPLEAAANYRSIQLVMKEGAIVDRDSLPTQALLTSAASGPATMDGLARLPCSLAHDGC